MKMYVHGLQLQGQIVHRVRVPFDGRVQYVTVRTSRHLRQFLY